MRWIVGCALALAACAGDPVCDEAVPGLAELGAGDLTTGFRGMADDDELAVELGPQGLHMVVVSVRVRSTAPPAGGSYRVTVAIEHGGQIVGGSIDELEPRLSGDAAEFLGLRAVFTIAEVRPLDGEQALIRATVTDSCEQTSATERRVTLRL